MVMTREKSFYQSFFKLFWPLVLQNIINLSVNLADNIMLGAYSETALAGATEVNQLQFILQCLVGGVGGGLTVLGSQYWGQKRVEPVRRLSSIAFWISVAFALILFTFCAVTPAGVIGLFIKDEAVISEGVKYLRIVKYSYPVFAVSSVLLFSLNCVETVKVAFWVSVQALVVNIGLNAVLITPFGSQGAAAATLAARVVSLVVVIVYMVRADKKLCMKLRDFLTFDKALVMDFVKIASPVVAVNGMWGFSNALQAVILGHMPNPQMIVAANSAAMTLYSLFKAGAQGAAAATAIVMAKTVGAGDIHKVREYSRTLQVMFVILGIITAALLFFARTPVLALYGLAPETHKMANEFILVLCVCAVGMSYQMPTITGIVRGGGDTKFCMINDIFSIWCVVLPVSALAAYKWGWSPVAVVACLNADQVFKCVAAALRCNSYKWVKKLTREDAAVSNSR